MARFYFVELPEVKNAQELLRSPERLVDEIH
jgi:hypothetical protein